MIRAGVGVRALLMALLVTAACAADPFAPPAPRPTGVVANLRLPEIALSTVEGARGALQDVTRGRIALINFWATWCDACKDEIPALRRLHERVGRLGVAVVGVNLGESPDRARRFVRDHRFRFANYCDERSELADALGISRLPATLVVDVDGRVVYRSDALDRGALAALRALLVRRGVRSPVADRH